MNRKKILIIDNSIDITGALNNVLRTSIALREEYIFIFALPVHSKAVSHVIQNGFEVYQVSMKELSKRWESILFYLPNLIRSAYLISRIVKNQNVALVHVNDFYNLNLPLWKCVGGSVPYVCHVNFVPDRFPYMLRKLWISCHRLFSSRIITVSQHVVKQLPLNCNVISIACALPIEIPFETVKREKTLLLLGNFIEGKGQDMAIRSFAKLSFAYPSWKLKMVGGDMGLEKNKQYKMTLRKLVRELGIESQVEWSDFSENVAHEYRSASVALNFSKSESFSLTVQEAMFYGCPIIVTQSGGPEELIENEYSGLIVPLDDISLMSKAIKRLIDDPAESERLMLNAAKAIREKSGKAETIDLLQGVYQSVLKDS